MSDFTTAVNSFVLHANQNLDRQVREITFELFSSVIQMSPVGNPELWEKNRVAKEYNDQVAAHNATLRDNPANLTANGRLRSGLKLNDGMDISKPKGYVGGRFRANWNCSVSAPDETTTEDVDPTGAKALAGVLANMGGAGSVTYLTNGLPYGEMLEYNAHSKQAPAGMVRISLAKIDTYMANLK